MSTESLETGRWDETPLESGQELVEFWSPRIAGSERKVLFLVGRGFDARMCAGLQTLLSIQEPFELEVGLIRGDQSAGSEAMEKAALDNLECLKNLVATRGSIRELVVKMNSTDGRKIASRSAMTLLEESSIISFTDVILDVSGISRSIYFPLAAKLLHLADSYNKSGRGCVNLHIWVTENSRLDAQTVGEGIQEKAEYIPPFTGRMDQEASADLPRVWMPMIGESKRIQMERVYDLVGPDEICPVLPSPARDPRRSDNLIVEYHALLFDSWQIESSNIIFGCERNPFEVYRQMRRAILSYRESFGPLGGSKFVISALSSKLLSIAALLVAYDFKTVGLDIGVAHVGCQEYSLESAEEVPSEVFGMWLTGDFEKYS